MVLESTGATKEFDIVRLYCDWALHPEITDSAVAQNMLMRVNECMLGVMRYVPDEPVEDEFQDVVARTLAIPTLRSQLKTLYARHQFASPFLDSFSGWQHLLAGIYFELANKPLRLPSHGEEASGRTVRGSAKRTRAEIRQKWIDLKGDPDLMINELRFEVIAPDRSPAGTKGVLHWMITALREESGKGKIAICSPVVPAEPPQAFWMR